MNEEFIHPELEVIQLDAEEILVQSGTGTASMSSFNAFGDEDDEEEW